MSHTYIKRLLRWFLGCTVLALLLCSAAGRWSDPWLWAYIMVFSLWALYPTFGLQDDLAKERFRPPDPGADKTALRFIRLAGIGHAIIAVLDVGRWHLTEVPAPLRLAGLAGMALTLPIVYRAMIANQFFSAVVRIQSDRGHRVIDQGPYAVVRHPGYVGMITAIPLGALALGSWLGFGLALVYSLMMLRRVIFEDAFLKTNLEGYVQYAARVRYRLIPGVW